MEALKQIIETLGTVNEFTLTVHSKVHEGVVVYWNCHISYSEAEFMFYANIPSCNFSKLITYSEMERLLEDKIFLIANTKQRAILVVNIFKDILAQQF